MALSKGPSGTPDIPRAEERDTASTYVEFWWAWLVAGILWIAASVLILQFDRTSITFVGVVIGVMFIVAGVQEFFTASMTQSGWRWVWVAFGVLLLFSGIWALVNPTQTVVVMADIIGFVFLLIGIGWTVQAFASMESSEFWGLRLVAGLLMIVLGFWAATQILITQAYTLLIFAGIWALLHGTTDIVQAFMIQRSGKDAFT